METELENLRREMLEAFEVIDSDVAVPYRDTACHFLRDCLRRAHKLGFDVTIRFSQGSREIELAETEASDRKPATRDCRILSA
jgi:hypothetical protein